MIQEPTQQYGRYDPVTPVTLGTADSRSPGPIGARQPEIPHQIDMLARAADGVSKAFAEMEARLSASILRSESPTTGGTGQDRQVRAAPGTPVGSRLQEINDTLTALRVRIESATMRLEA